MAFRGTDRRSVGSRRRTLAHRAWRHRRNGTVLPALPDLPDRVHLDVPADTRFLQVLRVAAATASIEVLHDFRAVDDLRLAVDELAAAAIAAAHPDARLAVELWAANATLRVRGRVRADGEAPELSDIGQLLVASATRSYRLARDGDDVVFELVVGRDTAV